MFEFLPSNTDSYGSLFSINAERKIINKELAYMARKQIVNIYVILIIKTDTRRLSSIKT